MTRILVADLWLVHMSVVDVNNISHFESSVFFFVDRFKVLPCFGVLFYFLLLRSHPVRPGLNKNIEAVKKMILDKS